MPIHQHNVQIIHCKSMEAILHHRQTIHDVCEIMGLTHGPCWWILPNKLKRLTAKFIPRLLNGNQKQPTWIPALCFKNRSEMTNTSKFVSNDKSCVNKCNNNHPRDGTYHCHKQRNSSKSRVTFSQC